MATTREETFFRCNTWEEAYSSSKGFENDKVVQLLCDNNQKNPPWGRKQDAHISSREVELVSALQYVCGANIDNGIINVADVGGGSGYLSIAARRLLPTYDFKWTVIESESMASAYSEFTDASGIQWIGVDDDISDRYHVGIISCTLQYLEKPFSVLKQYSRLCDYLILMRIPFVDSVSDVVTRQTFIEGIYAQANASWPAWFFSEQKFLEEISKIGNIVYRWKTPSEVIIFEGNHVVVEGMLVDMKSFKVK